MEVATLIVSFLLGAVAVYLIVRLLRRASRHDTLRRQYISGTSFRERRRFASLAREGEPIGDAQDAEKVKQLLTWQRSMYASMLSREPLQQLIAALILLTIAQLILQVPLEEPMWTIAWLVDVVFPFVALGAGAFVWSRMDRKQEEKIRANGWDVEPDPRPRETS